MKRRADCGYQFEAGRQGRMQYVRIDGRLLPVCCRCAAEPPAPDHRCQFPGEALHGLRRHSEKGIDTI